MSDAFSSPVLSPAFERARHLSKIMTVMLAIGFWLTLAWLIAVPVVLAFPQTGGVSISMSKAALVTASLSPGQKLAAAAAILIAMLPSLLILHHGRRIFSNFSKGNVFMAAPINHIRAAGLWLMVSAFAAIAGQTILNAFGIKSPGARLDPEPVMFFFGVAVYVAAYVMAEAQRISDENAGIV